MVIPLTAEEEWIAALQSTPVWVPPARPTIIVSPHPDDETLATGGLIAWQRKRDVPVQVIAVTDGDAAYPDQGLADRRRVEQERALQVLGVQTNCISRLAIPDSKVAAHEHRLTEFLYEVVTPESLVFAPWSLDWHADHEACGRAAERACTAKGAQSISYFFWTWHAKTPDSIASLNLRRFELDASLQQLKHKALQEHQSQLARGNGEPVLPPRLLAPAMRSFETFVAGDGSPAHHE